MFWGKSNAYAKSHLTSTVTKESAKFQIEQAKPLAGPAHTRHAPEMQGYTNHSERIILIRSPLKVEK